MLHNNFFAALKMAFTLPLAFLASVVGGSGWLFLLFLICAAADWITGSLTALKSGEWSSALAREGLSAAIYTQLSDVEDETNGVVTYDRRVVKLRPEDVAGIKEALDEAIKG